MEMTNPGNGAEPCGTSNNLVEVLDWIGDEDNLLKAVTTIITSQRSVSREAADHISDELKQVFTDDLRSIYDSLRTNPALALAMLLVLLFTLSLLCLIVNTGIAASKIISNSTGPTGSSQPGFWIQNFREDELAVTGAIDILYEKERLAAEYVEKCYSGAEDDFECSQYPTKHLISHVVADSKCPFHDDVCASGPQSALAMSSGLVDSKVLGINTPPASGFQFERNMTCAPIVNDDRYQWHDEYWRFGYSKVWDGEFRAPMVPYPWSFLKTGRTDISSSFMLTESTPKYIAQ